MCGCVCVCVCMWLCLCMDCVSAEKQGGLKKVTLTKTPAKVSAKDENEKALPDANKNEARDENDKALLEK